MSKEKVIPFRVVYYDITGDHLSALFLAQLEYWQQIKPNGWVAKTEQEWRQELRITYKMLQRLQSDLISLGLIEVKQMMFNGKKATHYKLDLQALKNSIETIETQYLPKVNITKGNIDERSSLPEVDITKGQVPNLPEVNSDTYLRSTLLTENTTENTTDIISDEKISSVPEGLFKSDKLRQLAEDAIAKGETGKTKSKPKKELSEQDKLIAEQIKDIAERFKKWYLSHKKIVYPYKRHDFVNLTSMFKDLCNNNGYTIEGVVKQIEKIVNGYNKLSKFSQNNFSLNLIATKYNVLLSEIDNYQPPVQKKNFNEPVANTVVKKVHRDTFNQDWLPVGITKYQFIDLAKAIAQEKIMNGDLPDDFVPYDFTAYLLPVIEDFTIEQVKALLNEYDVK